MNNLLCRCIKISYLALAIIFCICDVLKAGMRYDNIKDELSICHGRHIDGKEYVYMYLSIPEFVKAEEIGFRLVDRDVNELHLLVELVDGNLSTEDSEAIKENYLYRVLIPKDFNKYEGWTIEHNMGKGKAKVKFKKHIEKSIK